MDNMFLDSHVNLEGNKINLNNVVKRGTSIRPVLGHPFFLKWWDSWGFSEYL